jgi:hypothetical protein
MSNQQFEKMKTFIFLLCICLVLSFDLKNLKVKTDETSLSGFSSGAYFATQYQVAHSSSVIGSASVAGGPYGCNFKHLNNLRFTITTHKSSYNLHELSSWNCSFFFGSNGKRIRKSRKNW